MSSTAIPLPTEILTSILLSGGESPFLVGLVLVIGASIGGTLNYTIGFGGNKIFRKLKPKENKKENEKSHKYLDKFGWAVIFFSPFIPVIGDVILMSAGSRRMNFRKFMIIMIAGKIFKTVAVVMGLQFLT